jgi:hypothetical protein
MGIENMELFFHESIRVIHFTYHFVVDCIFDSYMNLSFKFLIIVVIYFNVPKSLVFFWVHYLVPNQVSDLLLYVGSILVEQFDHFLPNIP